MIQTMGDSRRARDHSAGKPRTLPPSCANVFSPKPIMAQKALWRDTVAMLFSLRPVVLLVFSRLVGDKNIGVLLGPI